MKAQTVPQLFRVEAQEWVAGARKVAQDLLLEHPTITILDVLEVHPLPKYLKKNIIGHVFKDEVFMKQGIMRSPVPVANGHFIHRWSLNANFYPTSVFKYRRRNLEEDGRDN